MNDRRGGWTFLKVVGFVVGLLGLVGFGLCSLCGFVIAGGDTSILMLALLGGVVAALCGWLVAAVLKSAGRDRNSGK